MHIQVAMFSTFVTILFLYVTLCSSSGPVPMPCPTPQDRAIAWYSGSQCVASYSCCFTEPLGNTTASCCYSYGSDGPYKCCGRDPEIGFIIGMSVSGGLCLIIIIVLVSVQSCRHYYKSRPILVRQQHDKIISVAEDDDKDIPLDNQ